MTARAAMQATGPPTSANLGSGLRRMKQHGCLPPPVGVPAKEAKVSVMPSLRTGGCRHRYCDWWGGCSPASESVTSSRETRPIKSSVLPEATRNSLTRTARDLPCRPRTGWVRTFGLGSHPPLLPQPLRRGRAECVLHTRTEGLRGFLEADVIVFLSLSPLPQCPALRLSLRALGRRGFSRFFTFAILSTTWTR